MGMNFMKPFSGVQKKITRGKPMCEAHTREGKLTNEQTASLQRDEGRNQTVNLHKLEDKN
jgi:hypothetical protein